MVKCSYCDAKFKTEAGRVRHESPCCPVAAIDRDRMMQPLPFDDTIGSVSSRRELFITALGLEAGGVNLDGASVRPEWLIAFHGLAHMRPGRLTTLLFPNRPSHLAMGAVMLLMSYADFKAAAVIERTRPGGSADVAKEFEAKCDAIYARLPSWARW